MTNFLQITLNDRKSRRQPQCTSQLVCEDRVLFVRVFFSRFFMPAAASKMLSSNSFLVSNFIFKLLCSSNPTNKNLRDLVLEMQTAQN